MSVSILLVEDDRELRRTLGEALRVEGYEVTLSASLADARAVLATSRADPQRRPQVILLDLNLPDGDGAVLLDDLRGAAPTAVIVLSARFADHEKVALLDRGADDYLVKPFSLSELLARIRVALRHRGASMPAARTHYLRVPLEVDLETRSVLRDGQPVRLTPTEYSLLARLVRQAGQVVTHRQLLRDVWGPEHVEQVHYLRLYMAQLRAKLEAHPAEPCLLLTEPGVGYRLADPA